MIGDGGLSKHEADVGIIIFPATPIPHLIVSDWMLHR